MENGTKRKGESKNRYLQMLCLFVAMGYAKLIIPRRAAAERPPTPTSWYLSFSPPTIIYLACLNRNTPEKERN